MRAALAVLLLWAAPARAQLRAAPRAPSGLAAFPWTPADRAAYFGELERGAEAAAAALGGPVPLRELLSPGALSVPRLAARKTLAEALARPKRGLPRLAALLREAGPRGARAAAALEGLAEGLPERRGPEGRALFRELARLRHELRPEERTLPGASARLEEALAAAFDGTGGGAADRRFSALSQLDRRFAAEGLVPRGEPRRSGLCGPTCLLNAAGKFGVRPRRPERAMARLVRVEAPKAGAPAAALIRHGLPAYQLKELARRGLRSLGLEPAVRAWGVSVSRESRRRSGRGLRTDIPYALFERALRADTAVIVNVKTYRAGTTPGRVRPESYEKPYLGGHYLLVSGLIPPSVPGGPFKVLFLDPWLEEFAAVLTPLRPGRHGVQVYRLDRERPSGRPGRRLRLLTTAIELRARDSRGRAP